MIYSLVDARFRGNRLHFPVALAWSAFRILLMTGRSSAPTNRRGVTDMVRHLVRTACGTTVLALCLLFLPGQAVAQVAGAGLGLGGGAILNDPFTFYYAVYLPNQQLQAMRPRPMDTIDSASVTRQYYAQNDRRGLYNPISPYGNQAYDPLSPYSRQQTGERSAAPYRFARDPSNIDGTGPSLYYGRAAQYFPGLRAGRGRNANIYSKGSGARPAGNYTGRGSGAGTGGGMGGMGGGGMGGMGGMGGGGMGGMGGMM
jgi:hypothetical protein